MTPQQLNFSTPLTHRDDPITSHIAEEKITKSGKLKDQCEQVYRAIVRYPNCTAGELAERSGVEYSVIQRRVSKLVRDGLVVRLPRRLCTVKRSMQTVLESVI